MFVLLLCAPSHVGAFVFLSLFWNWRCVLQIYMLQVYMLQVYIAEIYMLQIFIAAVDSQGGYVVPDEPLAWSSPGATLGVRFDMAGSLYICNAPLGLLQVRCSGKGSSSGNGGTWGEVLLRLCV